MAREDTRRVEIKGRTFQIEKMDALESLAVLKELLTGALPIDIMGMFGNTLENITGILTKKDMSIEEFVALEKRILRYTFEVLPTGLTRVVDGSGNFGVNDVEKDLSLVIKLLMEAVRLNYESFFTEMFPVDMMDEIQTLGNNLSSS